MRKVAAAHLAVIILLIASSHQAFGSNPGPVKISTMTRVESHSKISNSAGNFSGETFGYWMVNVSRELEKGTIGSIFYLNRYSFDEEEISTHVGGANVTHIFSPKLIGTLGYNYTSNPEQGTTIITPDTDRDRFSVSAIYNFNPEAKKGPLYSLTSSFSTVTDFGEQQTLSERLAAKFPKISKKIEGNLAYTYSYSLKESDQLTNQFHGNLVYKYSKTTKITLGVLFIDSVYDGNPGDDTVGRLTLSRSYR